MELDVIKRAINESSELSKQGEDQKALEVLDDAIAMAIRENHPRWVSLLSCHASVIAEHVGDLGRARQYRERSANHEPENPLMLFSLAEMLHRQGEDVLAKQYAIKAFGLSMKRNAKLDQSIVESLLQTWPDLAELRS